MAIQTEMVCGGLAWICQTMSLCWFLWWLNIIGKFAICYHVLEWSMSGRGWMVCDWRWLSGLWVDVVLCNCRPCELIWKSYVILTLKELRMDTRRFVTAALIWTAIGRLYCIVCCGDCLPFGFFSSILNERLLRWSVLMSSDTLNLNSVIVHSLWSCLQFAD